MMTTTAAPPPPPAHGPPPPPPPPSKRHAAAAMVQMTLASALHFAGYEYARSATMALFTSQHTGFTSAAAMPAATGLVSPCSLVLLWWYTGVVEHCGPRSAIRQSTILFCILNVLGGFLVLAVLNPESSPQHLPFSQGTALILLVTQNALVQLLFTQHWAFLGSIKMSLTDDDDDNTNNNNNHKCSWLAPIAGIGSLSSTLAASSVGVLVPYVNLGGLLLVAALAIGISGICADQAYRIAERHHFAPQPSNRRGSGGGGGSSSKTTTTTKSRWQQARDLFQRVPVLGALCVEVVVCQCLSSILSFVFHRQVQKSLPNDHDRARWTGQCYAYINGASGIMEFAILPLLVQYDVGDLRRLWPVMPVVMLICTVVMTSRPSLTTIAGAFWIMKTLEYSVRSVANEMVFTALDYESRFVGKEIVGMFANRLGKSGMAVVMAIVADRVTLLQLSLASTVLTVLWFMVSLKLVALIFVKKTAEGKEKVS